MLMATTMIWQGFQWWWFHKSHWVHFCFEGGWLDEVASCGERQTLWIHVCSQVAQHTLLCLTFQPPLCASSASSDCKRAAAKVAYLPSTSLRVAVRPANQVVKPVLSPPDVTSHSRFPWRCRNTLEQNAASVSWMPSEAWTGYRCSFTPPPRPPKTRNLWTGGPGTG